jgi:two-component system NarL family sensor kinase
MTEPRRTNDSNAQLAQTNADLRLEIEDRTLAEDVLRQLSHRVVQLQDEERRRIARELHDGIGQQLTAIIMGVSTLEGRVRPELRPEVKEILALVDNCIKDVRTISHLLHPPLLDEVGLLSALEGFVRECAVESMLSWRCHQNLRE